MSEEVKYGDFDDLKHIIPMLNASSVHRGSYVHRLSIIKSGNF